MGDPTGARPPPLALHGNIDLEAASSMFGLPARITAAESLAFLYTCMKSLRANFERRLSEANLPMLQQYYDEVLLRPFPLFPCYSSLFYTWNRLVVACFCCFYVVRFCRPCFFFFLLPFSVVLFCLGLCDHPNAAVRHVSAFGTSALDFRALARGTLAHVQECRRQNL